MKIPAISVQLRYVLFSICINDANAGRDIVRAVVQATAVDEKHGFRPTATAHNKWKKYGKPSFFRYWEFEDGIQIINCETSISNVSFLYPDFDTVSITEPNGLAIEVRNFKEWDTSHSTL